MNSPTSGMNLGQRIQHVGGRINAAGYVEFGSEMAVDALIRHVLRDVTFPNPESFQARYRLPGGTWSSWGHVICGVKGHEMQLRCVYSPNCYPQSELMDNNGNGAVPEDSRGMFVARLRNMQENGGNTLSVDDVLGLLNDCDMLATRSLLAAAPAAPDHSAAKPAKWRPLSSDEIVAEVLPPAEVPVPEEIERLAVNRYRCVPTRWVGYKIVAGDGSRALFEGTKDECYVVARKLTEAFLDGAHVAREQMQKGGA